VALTFKDVCRLFQAPTNGRARLRDYDPGWAPTSELKELTKPELKAQAKAFLQRNAADLAAAQERLYASNTHSVLIVLQASDAAGKDGTIKHVMAGVNPQGCQVFAFKTPSSEELDHNFLWRYMKALPERGRIGIFNRSYYEDVLVARVHPELVALPAGKRARKAFWKGRYDDINKFERHLARNGTLLVKIFLNVSKKEQGKRFMERLENPEKFWKFSFGDLEERQHWTEYQDAFEQMLQHTSTEWAPWWVVPADHKYVTRAIVGAIVTNAIKDLRLAFPTVSQDELERFEAARAALQAEGIQAQAGKNKNGKDKDEKKREKKREQKKRKNEQEKTGRDGQDDEAE
jgi:PPK2 family polyphosphate:nucleotide phosphotransferase